MNTREPLLLLHGVLMSANVWVDVVPLLADHHDVIAYTAAGHRGGPPLIGRATIASLTDDVERRLDASGLDRVHVAGNSMGGWMAIELARRARALTVCAFSPAGCWSVGKRDETQASARVRRTRRQVRLMAPVGPVLLRSARLRRIAMRDVAEHGERLTTAHACQAMLDVVSCPAAEHILKPSEELELLDPPPCPITIMWSGNDRIFPPHVYGPSARERVPRATHRVLADVGHVPMIDDPRACADTILATTGAVFRG